MGGKTRYESVQNGIRSMKEENALVAVHDGARPFIRAEEIRHAFRVAEEKGNAVFAVPLKDSLRRVSADGSSYSLDRSEIMQVQTPQIFPLAAMRKAYEAEPDPKFTDDATVMEMAGVPIFLCGGHYENIKITTPEDWLVAENILQQRKSEKSGSE